MKNFDLRRALGGGGKHRNPGIIGRWADLDAKMQRCEEAKSFTEITESILATMEGEEAIVHERLVSVTSAGAGGNQNVIIQSNPSPEFLNSLPFIKKFYPVLNLLVTSLALYEYAPAFTLCSLVLYAPRVPQKQIFALFGKSRKTSRQGYVRSTCSLLHLLAIRTRCTPSVRKFAAPRWGEGKFTKVSHETEAISRHSEVRQNRKNPAYLLYNTSKLKGIHMKNLTETDHASTPLGIFASELVSIKTKNQIAYPSKSSLIREDLCYSKVVHDNKFNSTETVHSPLTTHNSLKKVAFTLAEVLITLGIIGVVAALTLPTVIQNYQKQVTVNKLKKAYSVLGQVAQRAIADNGAISVMNGEPLNSNTCKSIFHTYWLPYFKGAEVYPEGKKPNLNDNTAFYRHLRSGYWDTNIYTQYAAGRIFFTTPDDMSFYIDIMKWVSKYDNDGKLISQTGVYNSFQTVYVDINGLKQPNTIGKDVFIFTIDFEKGIAKPWGYNSSDSAINSNDVYYAAKIIKDGWKITYPW